MCKVTKQQAKVEGFESWLISREFHYAPITAFCQKWLFMLFMARRDTLLVWSQFLPKLLRIYTTQSEKDNFTRDEI